MACKKNIVSTLSVLILLQVVCGIPAAGEPGSFLPSPILPGELTVCSGETLISAPQNPDFLEYLNRTPGEARILSLDEGGYAYGYIPPPVDLSHLQADSMLEGPALEPRYDLRDYGLVTPVKNQGQYGTCWAFASFASLESTGIPTFGVRDYSEKHMANLHGFDWDVYDGGNHLVATAYLTRWDGPVYEEEDPYFGSAWTSSPAGLPERIHCQEVLFLPRDTASIKQAVKEHGVVYTSYLNNWTFYTPSYVSYYSNGNSPYTGGHAVAIVGWDDTFNRSGFVVTPPGDGAFICKNSWGTGSGDRGYFYLSYYDNSFNGYAHPTVFTAEPATNYDAVHQYDPYGWTTSYSTGRPGEWAYAANVFGTSVNEKIAAIGFYTPTTDCSYVVYVYRAQNLTATQSGTIGDAGFHTVALDAPVRVRAGEPFTVCLALSTPGYNYPICVERPIAGYSSGAGASQGESYISGDGLNWIDISEQDMNVCIKAYARSIAPPNFTANATAGPIPLTVRFTDTSTENSSSWLWDFGDGQTSTDQNPTHTYTLPGNHTITLSVDDNFSTTTKSGCIRVTPVLFGDANEDSTVNQADTLIVLQEIVGLRKQPDAGTDRFQKADVHVNGMIDVGDALFIAQYNVGLRDIWFEAL
jgi:C1A family cysteine protease